MRGRVVVLSSEPPEAVGGVEHSVRELAVALKQSGYKVEVLHRGNCGLPALVGNLSHPLVRVMWSALVGYRVGRMAQSVKDADVVAMISHGPIGWYPVWWRRDHVKHIHYYHGTYRGLAEATKTVIRKRAYARLTWWDSMVLERLSGRGKICVCNSDETREEVRRFFGYEAQTVWLPMDTEHFRPLDAAQCRTRIGLQSDRAVGLFVGHVGPQKGFSTVRRLLDVLPDVQWLLAIRGKVPRDLYRRPGVRIFQDASYGEMPVLYNAADFMVCPSRYEPFGLVVAESLACGTPVIASSGGASRLFLADGRLRVLLVHTPEDVEQFGSLAREILSAPDEYRKLVLAEVRPCIEEVMSRANWWQRFSVATAL